MKEQTENKVKFRMQEVSFTLFFSLLFFAKGIGLYDGQAVFKIFLVGAIVCYGVKLFITEYDVLEFLFVLLIMVLAGIVYHNTKEKGILFLAMTVTGMKGISVKRLCYAALFVWCISFVPLAIFTMAGLVESPFKVHDKPLVGFLIRWGLGYVHPNVAHISYMVFTMLVLYAAGKRAGWKWLFVLFVGNCFVFGFTVSFTGFLVTSFYLAVNGYLLLRKKLSKWEYAAAQCVFPACAIISILLPLVLKGKAFDIVNDLMNTRLHLARLFLTQEKITAFGSGMQITTSMVTMDNSFVFAFMTYGVVVFVLLCAGYLLLGRRLAKAKDDTFANQQLAIMMSCFVAGVSEPFLFNTSFKNLTLVFLGAALFQSFAGVSKSQKTIKLLSGLDREWSVTNLFTGIFGRLRLVVKGKERKVAVGFCVGGVLLSMLCLLLVPVPKRIVVPKKDCDSVEITPIYVTAQGVGLKEGDQLLGFVDESTPMIPFEGDLIWIEQVRHMAVGFLLGGTFGGIVVILAGSVVQYRNVRKLRS